ncbi:hypothetical protein NC653_027641 [Populus alba x Populus x berolinensis]|uniref:Uncharacterized protein n=1 Tax=Populus alba x Populus x berolinensis TaxID=444605 RepID=A0AAD6Q5E6_9ROSI|nr:hypothetical protein NC653_027641 [Populus alba x Populus x berolinensis]
MRSTTFSSSTTLSFFSYHQHFNNFLFNLHS